MGRIGHGNASKGRPVQPILGIVAPAPKGLTPSQKELVRRAGTYLSPGQQITERRRARREEAEHEIRKATPPLRPSRDLHRIDPSQALANLKRDGEP